MAAKERRPVKACPDRRARIDGGSTICSSPWDHARPGGERAGEPARRQGAGPGRVPAGAGGASAGRGPWMDPPFVQVHGITRNPQASVPASRRDAKEQALGGALLVREAIAPVGDLGWIHHLFKSMGSRETRRRACRRAGATPRSRSWPGPCWCGRRQRRSGALDGSTICSSPWNDVKRQPRARGGSRPSARTSQPRRDHLTPARRATPRPTQVERATVEFHQVAAWARKRLWRACRRSRARGVRAAGLATVLGPATVVRSRPLASCCAPQRRSPTAVSSTETVPGRRTWTQLEEHADERVGGPGTASASEPGAVTQNRRRKRRIGDAGSGGASGLGQ